MSNKCISCEVLRASRGSLLFLGTRWANGNQGPHVRSAGRSPLGSGQRRAGGKKSREESSCLLPSLVVRTHTAFPTNFRAARPEHSSVAHHLLRTLPMIQGLRPISCDGTHSQHFQSTAILALSQDQFTGVPLVLDLGHFVHDVLEDQLGCLLGRHGRVLIQERRKILVPHRVHDGVFACPWRDH